MVCKFYSKALFSIALIIIMAAFIIAGLIAFPANIARAQEQQKEYYGKYEKYCKLGCPQTTDHFILQTNCNLLDYNSEKEIKKKAFRGQVYKIIPLPQSVKNRELVAIKENNSIIRLKNIRNKTKNGFRDRNNNEEANNNIYLINHSCGETHNFKLLFDEEYCSSPHNLPKKPALNNIDKEFLDVCGGWGQRVRRDSLEGLFNNPEIFNSIYEALEGEILTKGSSKETFKQELLDIWVKNKGFEHVFCGQPDPGRNLGGMHYIGRYLQMQENGWGGLNECCEKNQIEPPIYTIGIEYVTRIGNIKTKCPNGYLYDTEAINLLIEASKAFKKSLSLDSDKKRACNYQITGSQAEAQAVKYNMRLIRSTEGIITFYSTNHDECLKAIEGSAESITTNCYC